MPQLTSTNKKTYAVHDHWTDINKKNDVDITSEDGVITGIKVNGEDYGGGESDFSTAEVTITGIGEGATVIINGCYCRDEYNVLLPFTEIRDGVYTVPLYKGAVVFRADPDVVYTLSGNATDDHGIFITGDCTITIS